jgi:hypothetical protein
MYSICSDKSRVRLAAGGVGGGERGGHSRGTSAQVKWLFLQRWGDGAKFLISARREAGPYLARVTRCAFQRLY